MPFDTPIAGLTNLPGDGPGLEFAFESSDLWINMPFDTPIAGLTNLPGDGPGLEFGGGPLVTPPPLGL